MKNYLILILCIFCFQPAFSAQIDGTTFFSSFPSSYTCQGAKEIFGETTEQLGKISISINGQNTQNPVVELASVDGKINYKIGDGFLASMEKSPENCGYHFADTPLRMFYVCGLEIKDPVTFRQVMTADLRISFSHDLICTGGSICIRMSACK